MNMNRFEEAARERAKKSAELRQTYLRHMPEIVTDRVFDLANDQGHAYGWLEVESYYEDLAVLVNTAFQAGKAAGV